MGGGDSREGGAPGHDGGDDSNSSEIRDRRRNVDPLPQPDRRRSSTSGGGKSATSMNHNAAPEDGAGLSRHPVVDSVEPPKTAAQRIHESFSISKEAIIGSFSNCSASVQGASMHGKGTEHLALREGKKAWIFENTISGVWVEVPEHLGDPNVTLSRKVSEHVAIPKGGHMSTERGFSGPFEVPSGEVDEQTGLMRTRPCSFALDLLPNFSGPRLVWVMECKSTYAVVAQSVCRSIIMDLVESPFVVSPRWTSRPNWIDLGV